MARFRRKARSRSYGFKRKAKRSGSSSNTSLLLTIGAAMAYGAVREKASNALAPLTANIPLGNISDEIVLGTVGYFAAKKGKGFVKELGKSALIIESARIGEAVINGQVGLGAGKSSVPSTYEYP